MKIPYKIVPFEIELAKKIQSGEIEGRIVTNHGKVVTLVDAAYGFTEEYWIPIIWHWPTEHNQLVLYNSKGECKNSHRDCYLHIELPEKTPILDDITTNKGFHKTFQKHEFKVGDKVKIYPDKTNSNHSFAVRDRRGSVGYITSKGACGYAVKVIGLEDEIVLMPSELQLLEETSKHEFKPFDKVLVTQKGWTYWIPTFYRNATPDGKHICIDNLEYDMCIPYEGN